MTTRPRTPFRNCPICGIAMQAGRTREDSAHFDLFECLSCETTIRESKPATDGKNNR